MNHTLINKLGVWVIFMLCLCMTFQTSFATKFINDLHNISFDYDENLFEVYKKGSLIVMLVPKGKANSDEKEFPTFLTLKISKEIENFIPERQLRTKLNEHLRRADDKYKKEYEKSRKINSNIEKIGDYPYARSKYIYNKNENKLQVIVDNLYLLIYDLKIEIIFSTQEDISKTKKYDFNKDKYVIQADRIIKSLSFHKFSDPNVETNFCNGLLNLKEKKIKEALPFFEKAVELKDHIECLYYKAVTLSRIDKRDDALKILDAIIEKKKDFDYAWGYKAFNFIRAKQMSKAWECYEKGIEANPDSEILHLDRALFKLSSKSGDNKEVFADLNKSLLINPFFPKAHYQFGVLSALSGNQAMAAYCIQKAVAFDPENGDYWFMLGRILNSRREKATEAMNCLDKALVFQPKNARILVEKAKSFINLKDGNGALETLNQAIKIDRKNINAWYIKGKLLTEAEQYKEALTTYDRVIQMFPKDVVSWISKCNIYMKQENFKRAESMLNKALELDPNSIQGLLSKAALFGKTKREKQAVGIYNSVLRLEPKNEAAKKRKAELIRALTF